MTLIHKKKLAVYPYNKQAAPLIRQRELCKEYEITALCSPRGWSLDNKDAGLADNGPGTGMLVQSGFQQAVSCADAVFFTDYEHSLDFTKFIQPKMIMAMEAGKDILCGISLEQEQLAELHDLARRKKVAFTHLGDFPAVEYFDNEDSTVEKLLHLNTPVAAVFGISQNTNKFGIQLSLLESLKSRGYKVTLIGSRPYSGLVSGIPLPSFLFNHALSESQKIVFFNYFIKAIEDKENPDLILLGIPGGVMPFNDHITNGFGILAYEICQAVEPDFSILSLLYEDFRREYLMNLIPSMQYRLGADIEAFAISNTQIDWEKSESMKKPVFNSINSSFIDKKIDVFKQWEYKCYNIFNPADADGLCDLLLTKLNEYAEVVSV